MTQETSAPVKSLIGLKVLGLIFARDGLVMLNRIGAGADGIVGNIRVDDESSQHSMVRVALKCCGIEVDLRQWTAVAEFVQYYETPVLHVWATVVDDEERRIADDYSKDGILWAHKDRLPEAIAPNLRWIIPFAHHRISRAARGYVTVQYYGDEDYA